MGPLGSEGENKRTTKPTTNYTLEVFNGALMIIYREQVYPVLVDPSHDKENPESGPFMIH
jgi:hypothetical protein